MGKTLADALTAQPGSDSLASALLNKWGGRQSTNVIDLTGKLSEDEKRAAGLAAFIDQAALGYGTPALAGLMSILPGRGSYDDERFLAENLQSRLQSQDPAMNVAVRGSAALGPTGPLGLAAMAKNTALGSFGTGAASILAMLQGNAPDEWVPFERRTWNHNIPGPPAKPFSSELRD